MTHYDIQDGRVWTQLKKFEPYKLLLPYGMSSLTDPVGSSNPVREPDAGKRRSQVTVDIIRGNAPLHTFTIETRLRKTLNYMLAMRNRRVRFQAHLGQCGRPDNYAASDIAIHLPRCLRGDLGIDRVAIIDGDDTPINVSVPWTAEGLDIIDFKTEFLSARTISEVENLNFAAFIKDDCGEGYDPGQYGYVGGDDSLYGAVVWRTTDKGGSFSSVGYPFAASEVISDGFVIGEPYRHRILVARGTTDAGNPAEIAYADVGEDQTVSWVNVDIGTDNGTYVLALAYSDWSNIYASLDTGEIWKSTNGGASWSQIKATGNAVNDISALRDGTVLAAGASNSVYISQDYGSTWSALSGLTGTFTACKVTPDGTLFVGSSAGALYGSSDGGVVWNTLSLQGITPTAVQDIQADNDDIIWVVATTADGGRVLRSTDGGAGFYLWTLNIPTNDDLNAIDVIDPNFVWVVGDIGFVTLTNSQVFGVALY